MRNIAARAIGLWAGAGLLVSIGWGIYFGNTSKALPIEPLASTLAAATQPLAASVLALGLIARLDLVWVAIANAVTYALPGAIVSRWMTATGRCDAGV